MLKIYNTLTKELAEFKPIAQPTVKFYHCGPTVYSIQHIGNMRSMLMADLIRRSMLYLGYDVDFVRNYTDVGHLTGDNIGDADSGEDRMEKGAKREGLSPDEIADKYIQLFDNDIKALNIIEPTHRPRATKYVEEMIAMVEVLLDKGFAYTTPKAVYFDVSKKDDYTKLSGQKLELNEAGAGTGDVSDADKKHPFDFAVWFFRTGVHKNALQYWSSPFTSPDVENGAGFPGWHIECSAMAKALLGDTIDLHMGGIEHIPIHHTNEIAQSESANGVEFVKYWLHNEHLLVDGRKMAKSEGTAFSLADVEAKGFKPAALRYFFLGAHYRSKQNFTWEALEASATSLDRLVKQLINMEMSIGLVAPDFKRQFKDQISNDFNIPGALAVVWELIKSPDVSSADKLATILDFDQVLGLNLKDQIDKEQPIIEITPELQEVLDEREQARLRKDWKMSDELRDKLAQEYGVIVKDTTAGQELTVAN